MTEPSLKSNRRRAFALLAVVLPALLIALVAGRSDPASADAPLPPPNVVIFVADDQESATMTRRFMPQTMRLLGDGGTALSDFVITTPLCCPSRATLLTGQYGHNNGVLSNKPGYPELVDKENVLPAWMQRAGYTTAHVGKYLNGYRGFSADPNAIGPGWDMWFTSQRQRYYNYEISNNGTEIFQGHKRSDYATDAFNKRAVSWIRRELSGDEKPFFMVLDHLAPHADGANRGRCRRSAIPAKRDLSRYRNLKLPRPANFDERAIGDKPEFIRDLPRISRSDRRQIKRRYLCRVRSLRAVDRSVAKVMGALEATGELDETVVLYYSDNGFFSGEHRVQKSKGLAYEESIKVPALIRLPDAYLNGQPAPAEVPAPLANIDIAATVLDLAGGEPCLGETDCRVLDGRSFLGLIDNSGDPTFPASRPIEIEIAQDGALAGGTRACRYQAVRVDGQILIEHQRTLDPRTKRCNDSNEIEHYDLVEDPYELRNLYPAAPDSTTAAEQAALRVTLEELRDCAGIEDRGDPLPPSGHHCR